MKTMAITLCFIVWSLCTLFLVITVIGLFLLIREDHDCETFHGEEGEAVWLRIGKKLIDELV